MRPLRWLEENRGTEVAVVEAADPNGVPTSAEVAARVAEAPTALVVLTHASNVSGAVLPVAEAARAVAPVPVLVDAEIEPLLRGGTGSRSESEEMPEFLPDRLEAGTVNGAGAAGLGSACAWLGERTVEAVAEHEHGLVGLLAAGLSTIAGVQLHGWAESAPHTGILSFTVDGVDSGELAAWLDREWDICLRAGLHCAPAAHRHLGTFPDGTLRAGIGPFNTDADVDSLVVAIRDAAGGMMRS